MYVWRMLFICRMKLIKKMVDFVIGGGMLYMMFVGIE